MSALLDQVATACKHLNNANAVHVAVGAALTPEQQMAVSEHIQDGPDKFIAWTRTDAGRAAVRALADAFVAGVAP